ncbi:DUF1656 domain-containing protein [Methylopila musalis]|uniref:DUF1656 domain-containing protein n=1 Tax=Methylopila musalis TaxID=1134781 RepID=A0ABW3Z922_9HYPH
MIKELDLFGVYAPPLLLHLAVAFALWRPLRMALERLGFYRLVWRPALFNLAVYVITLAGVWAVLS